MPQMGLLQLQVDRGRAGAGSLVRPPATREKNFASVTACQQCTWSAAGLRLSSTSARAVFVSVGYAGAGLRSYGSDAIATDFSHYVHNGRGVVFSISDPEAPEFLGLEVWPGDGVSYVSHSVNGYGVTITDNSWLVVDRCR
jgi:hypothetical protein